jgi:hypothetical protein
MNQEMTENKCDSLSKKNGDTIAQLHHAQKTALDDTATALQSIIRQQQLTEAIDTSHQGNVTDAKKDVIDAMVTLRSHLLTDPSRRPETYFPSMALRI